jgi:hypothetical protein
MAAINVWNYYRISLDRDWLQDKGYAVLRAVADMICSAATPEPDVPSAYHMHSVVGFDDAVEPATDNALTVACAQLALRAAIEAAYELGYFPKDTWLAVRFGLAVPFFPDSDVLRRDAHADTSATIGILEPLLVLTPALNDITFGPDSGRVLSAAVQRNSAFWRQRVRLSAPPHPFNTLLSAQALAQEAQVEGNSDAVTQFDALVGDFMDGHSMTPWGNLAGYGVTENTNDLNLSAMFLMMVMQGLGGVAVIGGVTETQFYYSEMAIIAAMGAALPVTWERLHLRGVGTAQKDFVVINHILFPTAPLDYSSIAPWSVDELS